jgi:thioredoxin 1
MSVVEVVWKKQFDEIIASSEAIVLVDFWASRCGPCRMLWPVLHDLAEKYEGKVLVVKIDVDEDANAEIAMQYEVRSIPQVTLFKWWKQVDQFIGALPPDQVEVYINKYI